MTNGLNVLIYSKGLRFSTLNNKKFSMGQLINIMQVDSGKLYYMTDYVAGVLFLPLRLLIGIVLMYTLVGVHFASGLGVMVMLGFLNYRQGKSFSKYQRNIVKAADERMKITNETVSGIKLVKLNAWEEYFLEQIGKARETELKHRRGLFWVRILNIFIAWVTPVMVICSVFSSLVFFSSIPLTAASALTIIATFDTLSVSRLPSYKP
jgi:ABC-type multidrug transport system fused ATPase/permease subunit